MARAVRLRGRRSAVREYERRVERYFRGMSLEAHARLIARTPVDTGRLRGNWRPAIGRPERVTTLDVDKGGERTIARGARVYGRARLGQTSYSTNGLPYMPAIEGGHSRQAPRGVVALTIAEMRLIAERQRLRASGVR